MTPSDEQPEPIVADEPADCGCGMGEDCADPLNEQTPLNA